MSRIALGLIFVYQRWLSPLKHPTCRFSPSCSEYARIAIERYGFFHGTYRAMRRILKCHPWSRGGYDPVI